MTQELIGVYVSGVPHYPPKALRRWLILVVAWMTTLAGTAVILRYVSRRIRKQKLWWDDYMVAFSMVWNWVVVGIGFAMYIEGVGYHADTLPEKAIYNISKWLLITEIIYVWNLCWTKLSLLFMYYRIFHFPFFKSQVIAVGCFVIIWAITISFLFTFICVPVEKLWKPDLDGRCVSELGVWLANASSTIFSDIVILLLPIPQIWKLQLRTIEKVGLTMVFGLGFFYTLAPLLVWSDIEMCAGIISACLPTMRPVVTTVGTKLGIHRRFLFARSESRLGNETSGATNSNRTALSDRNPRVLQTDRSDRAAFYRLHDDSEADSIMRDTSDNRSATLHTIEHGKQSRDDGTCRAGQNHTSEKDVDTDGESVDMAETRRTAPDDIQLRSMRQL